MFTFFRKKIILFLFLFISIANLTFAQQTKDAKQIKKNADANIPLISSTLSVGIAFQISGIVLMALAHDYYNKNLSPVLASLENESASSVNRAENIRKRDEFTSVFQTYLISGASIFVAGTASTITGIVFAVMNVIPKPKPSILKNAFLSEKGSLAISASKNAQFHIYTNAMFLEINY